MGDIIGSGQVIPPVLGKICLGLFEFDIVGIAGMVVFSFGIQDLPEGSTLGDAVLKLIWSELFFSMGLDKDEITQKKADMENNRTLKNLCDAVEAYKFAYNDRYFADEAPKKRPSAALRP